MNWIGLLAKAATSLWTYLVLLVIALGVQQMRLGHVQTQRDDALMRLETQIIQTQAAVAANQSMDAALLDLNGRLQIMVNARAADAAAQAKLLAEREAAVKVALATADAERRKRADIWKTQSCKGLGEIRVDTACSDMGDRLRKRSAGGH